MLKKALASEKTKLDLIDWVPLGKMTHYRITKPIGILH